MSVDASKNTLGAVLLKNEHPAERNYSQIETEATTIQFPVNLATDLFTVQTGTYIVIVNSYSGFTDFEKLNATTSSEAVQKLKTWFSLFGSPIILESDNRTLFSSAEFRKSWMGFHPQYVKFDFSSCQWTNRTCSTIFEVVAEEEWKRKHRCSEGTTKYAKHLARSEFRIPKSAINEQRDMSMLPMTNTALQLKVVTDVRQNLRGLCAKQKPYADRLSRTMLRSKRQQPRFPINLTRLSILQSPNLNQSLPAINISGDRNPYSIWQTIVNSNFLFWNFHSSCFQ